MGAAERDAHYTDRREDAGAPWDPVWILIVRGRMGGPQEASVAEDRASASKLGATVWTREHGDCAGRVGW